MISLKTIQPEQSKFSNRFLNKIVQLFIFTKGRKEREEMWHGILS